jgi:succinate-acetate transporter protein
MLAAALSIFAKFMLISYSMKPLPYVEGWCWLAGAAFLTIVTPAYLKGSKIFFAAVVMADVVLWIICLMDLGIADPTIWKPIAAYLLIAIGAIGIYLAGATVCNTVFGRTIYPVPTPFVK